MVYIHYDHILLISIFSNFINRIMFYIFKSDDVFGKYGHLSIILKFWRKRNIVMGQLPKREWRRRRVTLSIMGPLLVGPNIRFAKDKAVTQERRQSRALRIVISISWIVIGWNVCSRCSICYRINTCDASVMWSNIILVFFFFCHLKFIWLIEGISVL